MKFCCIHYLEGLVVCLEGDPEYPGDYDPDLKKYFHINDIFSGGGEDLNDDAVWKCPTCSTLWMLKRAEKPYFRECSQEEFEASPSMAWAKKCGVCGKPFEGEHYGRRCPSCHEAYLQGVPDDS
jgi:rubrerythrin